MTQLKGEISPCGTKVIECNPLGDKPKSNFFKSGNKYYEQFKAWQQAEGNRMSFDIKNDNAIEDIYVSLGGKLYKPGTLVTFHLNEHNKAVITGIV